MKLTNLLEAINYEQMFDDLRDGKNNTYPDLVTAEMKWAKINLKKNDRIIWWLRLVKVWIAIAAYHDYVTALPHEYREPEGKERDEKIQRYRIRAETIIKKFNSKSKDWKFDISSTHDNHNNNPMFKTLDSLKKELVRHKHEDLKHFLEQSIPKIDNHIFGWEGWDKLKSLFVEYEEEYVATHKEVIDIEPDDILFLDVGGGFAWYDLDKPYCQKEGDAMGHCGNVTKKHLYDTYTILSLRKKIDDKTVKPYATFILDKDEKMLGEISNKTFRLEPLILNYSHRELNIHIASNQIGRAHV